MNSELRVASLDLFSIIPPLASAPLHTTVVCHHLPGLTIASGYRSTPHGLRRLRMTMALMRYLLVHSIPAILRRLELSSSWIALPVALLSRHVVLISSPLHVIPGQGLTRMINDSVQGRSKTHLELGLCAGLLA